MAWYEETGPTFDDAFNAIKIKVTPEEISDEDLKLLIQEQIDTYGNLGSWRGFSTFAVGDIMKEIKNRNQKDNEENN